MKVFRILLFLFLGAWLSLSKNVQGQPITCQLTPDQEDLPILASMFQELSQTDPTSSRRALSQSLKTQMQKLSRKSLEALFFHYLLIRDKANPLNPTHINQTCDRAKEYSAPQVSAVFVVTDDIVRNLSPLPIHSLIIAIRSMQERLEDENNDFSPDPNICNDPTNNLDQLGKAYLRFTFFLEQISERLRPEETRGQTCCICQVGTTPKWQRALFRTGCNMWLSEQHACDISLQQPVPFISEGLGEDFTLDIPMACYGGQLKLGYVGHWDSAQTDPFLSKTLIPTAKYYKLSNIQYDNTACSALENAENIQHLLQTHTPENMTIDMIGNQCISYGMWDRFLGYSPNFRCRVGTDCEATQYPLCSQYKEEPCGYFQKDQHGICLTDLGDYTALTCCKIKIPHLRMFGENDTGLHEELRWIQGACPSP